MTNAIFAILYFLGALSTAHMSIMFAILNETWLAVMCFIIAGLFLVLMYKDGIMAYDK